MAPMEPSLVTPAHPNARWRARGVLGLGLEPAQRRGQPGIGVLPHWLRATTQLGRIASHC